MQQKQAEQGFISNAEVEYQEYAYRPICLSYKHIKYRGYVNPYARQNLLSKSPFINQKVREKVIDKIITEYNPELRKKIIFNNFNRFDVTSEDPNIEFSSNFESGNLELAIKNAQDPHHYNLYIRPDTNTKSYYQWFYFKVKVRKAPKSPIKFTIKNFVKSGMLYKQGLKPYYRSSKENSCTFSQLTSTKVVWEQDSEEQQCYNMTFWYSFQFDNEEVQFASQPPYTYDRLCNLIKKLRCQKKTLCKSVMGIPLPYLVYQARKQCKVACLIIARQHPGESVGWWLMEGFIKKVDSRHTKQLGSNFDDYITWVIVPMVNVDGVILGNNRTGVLGHDFNRNWVSEDSKVHRQKTFPEIINIVDLIKKLKKNYPGKVKMFLDLHGHSSQPNVFSYGPPHEQTSDYYFQSRVFTELLANRNHNFNLDQCSFNIKAQKKRTSRFLAFSTYSIPFSYTIQSTFGVMRHRLTKTEDFLKVGQDIAVTVFQFLSLLYVKTQDPERLAKVMETVTNKYKGIGKQTNQQFDSGSEASIDSEERQQFEKKIIEEILIEKESPAQTTNFATSSSTKNASMMRLKTEQILEKQSIFQGIPEHSFSKQRKGNKSRRKHLHTNTQSSLPQIRRKHNLIHLKRPIQIQPIKQKEDIKSSKTSLLEDYDPLKMSLKDIHLRLLKLRNSKIGRNIVIINPYGI